MALEINRTAYGIGIPLTLLIGGGAMAGLKFFNPSLYRAVRWPIGAVTVGGSALCLYKFLHGTEESDQAEPVSTAQEDLFATDLEGLSCEELFDLAEQALPYTAESKPFFGRLLEQSSWPEVIIDICPDAWELVPEAEQAEVGCQLFNPEAMERAKDKMEFSRLIDAIPRVIEEHFDAGRDSAECQAYLAKLFEIDRRCALHPCVRQVYLDKFGGWDELLEDYAFLRDKRDDELESQALPILVHLDPARAVTMAEGIERAQLHMDIETAALLFENGASDALTQKLLNAEDALEIPSLLDSHPGYAAVLAKKFGGLEGLSLEDATKLFAVGDEELNKRLVEAFKGEVSRLLKLDDASLGLAIARAPGNDLWKWPVEDQVLVYQKGDRELWKRLNIEKVARALYPHFKMCCGFIPRKLEASKWLIATDPQLAALLAHRLPNWTQLSYAELKALLEHGADFPAADVYLADPQFCFEVRKAKFDAIEGEDEQIEWLKREIDVWNYRSKITPKRQAVVGRLITTEKQARALLDDLGSPLWIANPDILDRVLTDIKNLSAHSEALLATHGGRREYLQVVEKRSPALVLVNLPNLGGYRPKRTDKYWLADVFASAPLSSGSKIHETLAVLGKEFDGEFLEAFRDATNQRYPDTPGRHVGIASTILCASNLELIRKALPIVPQSRHVKPRGFKRFDDEPVEAWVLSIQWRLASKPDEAESYKQVVHAFCPRTLEKVLQEAQTP